MIQDYLVSSNFVMIHFCSTANCLLTDLSEFCLKFVRIHDLSNLQSKCWIFWDQSTWIPPSSLIGLNGKINFNKATSLAIIAAFSVLFKAPQKYNFNHADYMVIWYLNWTVFCQFLICLIFIDLSGWLSDRFWWSWGRLFNEWTSIIVVLKPDGQVKLDAQDASSSSLKISLNV